MFMHMNLHWVSKEIIASIDDLEYVYMLGIATLLDGTHKSVKFMEAAWSVQLQQEWKRLTTQWEASKNFSTHCKVESQTL